MEKNGHTVRDKAFILYDESAKSPRFTYRNFWRADHIIPGGQYVN